MNTQYYIFYLNDNLKKYHLDLYVFFILFWLFRGLCCSKRSAKLEGHEILIYLSMTLIFINEEVLTYNQYNRR